MSMYQMNPKDKLRTTIQEWYFLDGKQVNEVIDLIYTFYTDFDKLPIRFTYYLKCLSHEILELEN